jgi:tetratricopeptide (TPR) repeat protein
LTQVQITNVEEIVDVAVMLSDLLGRYYGLIFTLVIAMGLVLMAEGRKPRESGSLAGFSVLVVGMLLAIPAIRSGSYNLIRADVIFKQGKVFANANSPNEKQIGIQHYEKSIEYAPQEDYYYLFLGKAYLELAQGLPNDTPTEQREAVFLQTEEVLNRARELNPLNTDHSANLARFYKSWAARVNLDLRAEDLGADDRAGLQDKRMELLRRSLENYEIALTLSPNNPIIWNELAQLYAVDLDNQELYQETIQQSLAVDDEFEQTWMLMGDLRSSRGDIEGAIDAYLQALEIDAKWRSMEGRQNCSVRRVVGTLYAQQSQWEDAVDFLETSIERCQPRFGELWEMHRVLAIAYANQGRTSAALDEAHIALRLAPEGQQPTVQQLIDQLSGPPVTDTITTTTQP